MKNRATGDFIRTRILAASHVTKTLATLILIIAGATWVAHAQSLTTFYVATNGNDSWNGKSPTHTSGNNGPFASLAKAKSAVEGVAGTSSVSVQVRGGTYYLPLSPTNPGTLTLGTADSGNATNNIVWQNYATETPVVSGGIPVGVGGLGLTWTEILVGGKILWQVQLPSTIQPFEYLFYTPSGPGGTGSPRRLRSRLESANGVGYYMNGTQCTAVNPLGPPKVVANSFCNLGTFLREGGTVAPTDPDGVGCPSVTNANNSNQSKCTDRFYYNSSDPITQWINLNGTYTGNPSGTGFQGPCEPTIGSTYPVGDIGITLFDAWTVDAMRVACLDPAHNVVFLIGPASSSSGVYDYIGVASGHRYLVENAKDAFSAAFNAGQTGLWFWDRSNDVLSYIPNSGELPNSDTVVIPQLGGQFPVTGPGDYIGGSLISATNLSYVTFKNITFEVDNFIPSFTTGFNKDVNGEMSVPQAIDCESCQNVVFDTITVRRTSASGILIASPGTTGPPAQNDTIQNSTFYDIGDSGIRIGHTPVGGAKGDQAQFVVNHVTVQNNLIQGYSRVFADGEGIAEGNGNAITYSHNDINDGYHAGISICQLDCPNSGTGANGTNIVSQYNHLWNLMQGVTSDGGSLYYNIGGQSASGSKDKIYNNLVHDTTDSSIIDVVNGVRLAPGSGYGGEGIYLDAQSAGVDVENNVVYHVSAYTAWMTSGPSVLNTADPNTFTNNIFSLGILGMFGQQDPWPLLKNVQPAPSCGSGYPIGAQVRFHDNIFNFDLNESLPPPSAPPSFHVVWGCTDSCTLNYNQFQDFQGNAYWRAGTPGTGPLFCSDTSAFYVITNPPTGSNAAGNNCPISPNSNNSNKFTFLTFDLPAGGVKTWQHGEPPDPPGTPVPMNEDPGGVCNYNPAFGTTGNPSDYLLSTPPPTPFNIALTNDTISHAGRTSGPSVGAVPATFPTYSYTNTQF